MAVWIKTYKGKNYDDVHDCKNAIWDCTCSVCGWRTGQQGVNFQYCPICGVHMENANVDIVKAIAFAIDATDGDDEYSRGMRNGMRYVKSLIDGKEPEYESGENDGK